MKQAFPPLVNQNSKILILGTMPGEKSLELQEYYGNKGNSFWKLLFTLFNQPLPKEYAEKKQLLEENDIALWDVLAYCERTGSLDSNIKNEKANDFESFYKQYPNIKHVFFSSKNASNFYDKYVGRKKDLQYSILPSPSGANASKSFLQKLEEWEAILEALK
ncbi:DNA-deoxyinosine glycosylase [Flavobacterium lindanitolerans]|jgi:hypoxanthine-DNA glycosylase|uniref:DNA-deoxyinosine glycosylase n=1 Tax=Flavobacterium lindanitolerans TaxID=428988 RepID=UPI0028080246|nr:DNA-deoxyinosine glycosylase [Flavobacterium lindanitolerans]MDQ7960634.1 DNA-deoxyinosine glycosylase [Flavobacterium lindanitolerans]